MESCEDPEAMVVDGAITSIGFRRHNSHLDALFDFLVRSSFGNHLKLTYNEVARDRLCKAAYSTQVDYKNVVVDEGEDFACIHVLYRGVLSLEHVDPSLDKLAKPGATLGVDEMISNKLKWASTARVVSEGLACFVSIPRAAIQEVIGIAGSAPQEEARIFWQYHGLWKVCSPEMIVHPAFKCLMSGFDKTNPQTVA